MRIKRQYYVSLSKEAKSSINGGAIETVLNSANRAIEETDILSPKNERTNKGDSQIQFYGSPK